METDVLAVDRTFDRDWLAVAAAAAGLMFSVGALTSYPFGVFMGPIGHDLSWTRGQMSAALTVAQISLVLSSLVWGVFLDRFGPRRMLLLAIVGLGLGVVGLSRLSAPISHLYLAFALLPMLAAAANPLGYSGVLVRRFQSRLGFALGLSLMGVGLGAAILPVLSQHFITRFGWRSAYLLLAAMAVLVGLPAAVVATRNASGPIARAAANRSESLLPLMRTRAFVLTCCIFFLLGTAGTGVLTHLVPMMTDQGFTPAAAAKFAGLIGVSTLVSRGIVGWLLDRVHAAIMVSTVGLLCCGMCLLLVHGGGTAVYATASILLGFAAGADVDFISYLVRRYFGPAAFGRLYSFAFAAFLLGPGPILIGKTFDHFHSYRPGLLISAGLSLVAGALAFALPKYEPLAKRSALELSGNEAY